jgi:hypothetical protein
MYHTRVIEATSIWDCESQYDCVCIKYTFESPGVPKNTKTEYIYTRGLGNWTRIEFPHGDDVSVEKFLECLTDQNTEVLRKMCSLLLDKIGWNTWEYVYLVSILDPTFCAPKINNKCRWQRELGDSIVTEHFRGVIETCTNTYRLKKLYNELKQIIN